MKTDLFIFGAKENAELANFYFTRDREDIVVRGFVEDEPTIQTLDGLPVVAEEEFLNEFSAGQVRVFAPFVSGRAREKKQSQLASLGYLFETYISPKATVWDARAIGANCFIQELNNIQYGTFLGDGCSLWAGNHIGHHGKIEPFVTFTSHVVLSGRCHVGSGSYFGVNATVRDGTEIGEDVFIGQGANVTKDLLHSGVYVGSPARKISDVQE